MELINIKKHDYKREFTFDLGHEVKDGSHVKVSFYVGDGGVNYFTSKNEKKGYYVSVQPVTITFCNGYNMERTTMFSGLKMLLKEISRKSKKSFNSVIDELNRSRFYMLCQEVADFSQEEREFMYQKVKENWG